MTDEIDNLTLEQLRLVRADFGRMEHKFDGLAHKMGMMAQTLIAVQRDLKDVKRVVVRHARANEDFRRQLASILRAEVKAKADLATIAGLLIDPSVPK
jgi:hypothetical protein